MSFRCHFIWQQGLHSQVVALSAAFLACNTWISHCNTVRNLRTASDKCCEALATRLHVAPFSSRIQPSLLPRWPHLAKKKSTDEATTWINSVAPVSKLRIWGGRLHRDIQAPPPCKRPRLICGAWASSAHGCLPGTIWYIYSIHAYKFLCMHLCRCGCTYLFSLSHFTTVSVTAISLFFTFISIMYCGIQNNTFKILCPLYGLLLVRTYVVCALYRI